MAQDSQNVPKYFADLVKQNADEHAALAKSISDLAIKNADEHGQLARELATTRGDLSNTISALAIKNADEHGSLAARIEAVRAEITSAETRTTRWTALLVIGGLTIAVAVILNFG